MNIRWTLRKRLHVALWAALVQAQAARDALRRHDPYEDPEYVSPVMRQAIIPASQESSARPDPVVFG